MITDDKKIDIKYLILKILYEHNYKQSFTSMSSYFLSQHKVTLNNFL
jgi:hypothetical protein